MKIYKEFHAIGVAILVSRHELEKILKKPIDKRCEVCYNRGTK